MLRVMVTVASLVALVIPTSSPGIVHHGCNRPSAYILNVKLPREYPQFKRALVKVFKHQWKEAAIVSYGESTWQWDNTNGQYLGYFMVGAREREVTNWNWSLYGQLRSAKKWNDMNGGHWARWSCKP
jgi:hypothetical protein